VKPSERVEYKDSDGLSVSLYRLVTLEPSWAASRINHSVDRIAELEQEHARLKLEISDYRMLLEHYGGDVPI
jgi:hypothetical protein